MNTCQNCGKLNTPDANFCRACGTKFTVHQPMPVNPYDHAAPPRAYSWKTDEFQTQNEPRPTIPINRIQPRIDQFAPTQVGYQPAPLAYQNLQQMMHSFQCPRCMSKYTPRIERRISTAGWITFAVLLVFFFPLFWIGLLIKEDAVVCQTCNLRVN